MSKDKFPEWTDPNKPPAFPQPPAVWWRDPMGHPLAWILIVWMFLIISLL